MDLLFLGSLLAFVTASTITPGPNSIMIMASGVNFGFARTIPHVLGVAVGITTVITLAGIGLGAILGLVPQLRFAMLVASATYLLYLAWKIANAAPAGGSMSVGTPFTFIQALGFQWVNPKVWALGMAAVAIYAPQNTTSSILLVALSFALVGLVSNTAWAWFGTVIRRFLSTGRRLRVFNVIAALSLVASLLPAFLLN
jgi:threonine/homoserine/homoserine lactone efflux protein